jgi:hypothetical protein
MAFTSLFLQLASKLLSIIPAEVRLIRALNIGMLAVELRARNCGLRIEVARDRESFPQTMAGTLGGRRIMTLPLIAIIAALVYGFIAWRWTSVGRGAQRRDARIVASLEPLLTSLNAGDGGSLLEVDELAARPELRYVLFAALLQVGRSDLVPTALASSVEEGKSALAYWMMHPNELQDAPESIEFLETIQRTVDGRQADFHVYRYRMAAGHWAANDGWLLGLAGPMPVGVEPYSVMPGAFARASDTDGKTIPAELVDWYVGMLLQKGLVH